MHVVVVCVVYYVIMWCINDIYFFLGVRAQCALPPVAPLSLLIITPHEWVAPVPSVPMPSTPLVPNDVGYLVFLEVQLHRACDELFRCTCCLRFL